MDGKNIQMNVNQFMVRLDELVGRIQHKSVREAFIENMEHLSKTNERLKDKSFCSWMMTYLAWNELGDEEDCEQYYWDLMLEDE